jgi:SAM-dependent methyltransferase
VVGVTAYERFADFYDEVMDDPGPRADRVARWIEAFRPGADSLLELGAGTGSLLARLPGIPSLTGLERSPAMLAIARSKVPGARLLEGDIASCDLGRRFDVVCCVFDTLNHLPTFEDWCSAFAAAHAHLEDGGLFVFDVNTVGELRRLGDEPPWVQDFERGTAIIDVTAAGVGDSSVDSVWDIRVFEQVAGGRYQLHQERIPELAVPLARIRSALAYGFEILTEVDDDGAPPTDDSVKAHFACRRRSKQPGATDGPPG